MYREHLPVSKFQSPKYFDNQGYPTNEIKNTYLSWEKMSQSQIINKPLEKHSDKFTIRYCVHLMPNLK